jgi:hypothetical protein
MFNAGFAKPQYTANGFKLGFSIIDNAFTMQAKAFRGVRKWHRSVRMCALPCLLPFPLYNPRVRGGALPAASAGPMKQTVPEIAGRK